MIDHTRLTDELIDESIEYLNRIANGFIEIESEYYWEDIDRAREKFLQLFEGLFSIDETYKSIINSNSGRVLVVNEFVEANIMFIELQDYVRENDWLSILDFFRFKFKRYIIFMTDAFMKAKQQGKGEAL